MYIGQSTTDMCKCSGCAALRCALRYVIEMGVNDIATGKFARGSLGDWTVTLKHDAKEYLNLGGFLPEDWRHVLIKIGAV